MSSLTDKMKLNKFDEVFVLNKPQEFHSDFNEQKFPESLVHTSSVDCAIIFAKQKEDFIGQMLTLFPRLQSKSVLWVIFPKQTTKTELAGLHLEFDWEFLGDYRLQPTRQIPVNHFWNAIKLKKAKMAY